MNTEAEQITRKYDVRASLRYGVVRDIASSGRAVKHKEHLRNMRAFNPPNECWKEEIGANPR